METLVNETLKKYPFFSRVELERTYLYAERKCEVNGKGSGYISLLWDDEIRALARRKFYGLVG